MYVVNSSYVVVLHVHQCAVAAMPVAEILDFVATARIEMDFVCQLDCLAAALKRQLVALTATD